jgi:hypothetical protein
MTEVWAHCPADAFEFRPRYTDGACPICGWPAPDVPPAPWSLRMDWFWPLVATLAVVSIVMGMLVTKAAR